MNFLDNRILYLILVFLPLLGGIYIFARSRNKKHVSRFCDDQLACDMILSAGKATRIFRVLMMVFAVALTLTAAAGPRWGFHFEEITGRSASIVVALDISKSMLAEDTKPNRLDRAKRELLDLLDLLKGERVGVVGFAGTAYVQSPLTVDYSVLKSFVMEMNPDTSISSGGSDIGLAVSTARKLFKEEEEGAILLITDGEDFEGELVKEAEKSKKEGILIYSIGIGNKEGAPIPESGGFKKDSSGNLVITNLDESLLEKVSELTGGFYVRSVAGDDDARLIYNQGIKKQIGEVEYSVTKKKIWEERFQWFLLPALLLLFAEQLIALKSGGVR